MWDIEGVASIEAAEDQLSSRRGQEKRREEKRRDDGTRCRTVKYHPRGTRAGPSARSKLCPLRFAHERGQTVAATSKQAKKTMRKQVEASVMQSIAAKLSNFKNAPRQEDPL